MTSIPKWVKLPTFWIEDNQLHRFRWERGVGSANIAALMTLTIIAHRMRPADGVSEITYDELSEISLLSRAKVSDGLSILEKHRLIERKPEGRSSYKISGYTPDKGWAKFPARGLYKNGVITAFKDFRLRQPAELDALKLYFLFVSRRSRDTNTAKISYEKIQDMTGIASSHIRRGLTILGVNGLVHVEHMPSDHRFYNAYRIPHIEPYRHLGTTLRGMDRTETESSLT